MTRTQFLFWFDSGLLVSFCALQAVRITGVPVHEWLGVAMIAAMLLHLLLGWHWIASSTARMQHKHHRDRRALINYALNLSLFICMTVVLFSGIMWSEYVLPALHLKRSPNDSWMDVHEISSNIAVALAGLHVALNWDWIVAAWRRRRVAAMSRLKLGLHAVVPRTAALLLAAALVVGTSYGIVRVIPPDPPSAKQEEKEDRSFSVLYGGIQFVFQVGLVGAVAFAGRKFLKLRLHK